MKKIFYFIIAVFAATVGLFFISSCDNDQIEGESSGYEEELAVHDYMPSDEDIEMFKAFSMYNDSLSKECSMETRVKFRNRFLNAVLADAIGATVGGILGYFYGSQTLVGGAAGAIVGGLACGVLGSIGSYYLDIEFFASRNTSNLTIEQGLNMMEKSAKAITISDAIDLDSAFVASDMICPSLSSIPVAYRQNAKEVGMTHNYSLKLMMDNGDNYFAGKTVANEYQTFLNDSTNVNLILGYVQEIHQGNYQLPAGSVEYETMNYLSTALSSASTPIDASRVVDAYIKLVNVNSSLSDTQKTIMYNAFSVALYSFNYWYDYYQPFFNEL